MATSKAARPFLLPFLYPPRCLPYRSTRDTPSHLSRLFSDSPQSCAKSSVSNNANRSRNSSQPSLKVTARDQMKIEMPNDLGLLPGTFIMPSGTRLPSFVYSTRHRLQLEWKRVKERFQDLRGRLAYKWYIAGKPRPKMTRRGIVRKAKELHEQMYEAFFDRDLATLESICCEGLFASFRSRMGGLPPKVRHEWTVTGYNSRPRIVANRATYIPVPGMGEKMGMRQVVVRIDSNQRVDKISKDTRGNETRQEGTPKPVKEFLVLQRRLIGNEESDWILWGTTEESSSEVTASSPSPPVSV